MFKKKIGKEKSKIQSPAMKPHLTLTLLLEFLKKRKEREKGKRKIFSFLLLSFVICHLSFIHYPLLAQVPHLINFQSLLTDAAGSPLSDGVHRITFRIVDAKGVEGYKETQNLESVHGVVSAMVGSLGELNLTMFDPKVSKFLGVQVEGKGPETLLEIASVPYAMTAEQTLSVAPQSITAEAIRPKTITADLLADDVIQQLLTRLQTGGAGQIGVANTFVYSQGSTMEGVLKDLDTAVYQRQVNLDRTRQDLNQQITNLNTSLTTEQNTRAQADTNLQTQINTANTNINTANTNITSLQGQIITTNGRIDGINSSVSADKSATDDRLAAVERSMALRPFAFGRVGSSDDGCPLSASYNIASSSGHDDDNCHLTFSNPATSSSYVVLVTRESDDSGSDNTPTAYSLSTTGFSLGTGYENNGAFFVVFGNF